MIPVDVAPARVPAPAEGGKVRAVSGKEGSGAGAEKGAGDFGETLKSVAQDTQEKPTSGAAAADAGKAKRGSLDLWQRLQAEKAALKGEAGKSDGASGVSRVKGKMPADAKGDGDDAQSGSDDETGAASLAAAGAEQALAMILGHDAGKHSVQKSAGAMSSGDPKAGTAAADAAVDVAAAGPLRQVKITSVQLETHFAPVTGAAGAAGLAQKLTGIGQGLISKTPSPDAGAAAAKAEATGEKVLDAKGAEFAKLAAGAQSGTEHGAGRRGAETALAGNSGSNGNAAVAATGEKKAAVALPTAGDGLAAQSSAGQQLGARLLGLAQELTSHDAAPTAAPAAVAADTTASQPVRVLNLNLHPEELGSVTVRMALVRDAIEVQIEAEHPSTARMLQSDSSALSDMLRGAGIQVDGITVRAAAPDTVSANTGSTQSFLGQSGSGGAQADARAAGGNGREAQGQGQSSGERAAGRRENESNTSQRPVGGGLYV